jgi:Ala-tRNA(Pro) deacylase
MRGDTMAIIQSLQRLLDDNRVHYEVHAHPTSFTAKQTAAADHVPPSEMAKVVVLKSGVRERFLMAVLPATHTLDLDRLREEVGDPKLRLAAEREFADAFADCEPGAIPPFGQLFDMPMWVDDALGREREMVFNAGNHRETVHLAYQDFVRLAKPEFGEFSRRGDVGH